MPARRPLPATALALAEDLAAAGLAPRCLTRLQAAAYVGLSPNSFDNEVAAGTFPAPIRLRRTRRLLWDRAALDGALDAQRGLGQDHGHVWEAKHRQWREDGPPPPGRRNH